MNGALARLLARLACVLLPLAAVSTWVHLQVVDSSAYVGAVAPLSQRSDVREAAVASIEHTVLRSAGFHDSDLVAQAIDPTVRKVVASDGFSAAWESGNREAHAQLIDVLADDGRVDESGDVSVDLSALAAPVSDAIGIDVPSTALSKVGFSLHLVDASDLAHARATYAFFDTLELWPAALWLVLVVTSLLLPGSRRRTISTLAVGSLVSTALVAAALLIVRRLLVDGVPAPDADLVGDVWDALARSLWIGLGVVAGAAALALVGRLLVGVRRPARSSP